MIVRETDFREFISNSIQRLLPPQRKLYIWGAGVAGEALHGHLCAEPLRIDGFLDSNPQKQGKSFCGLPVFPPEKLEEEQDAKVILASLDYPDGMERYLRSIGKEENKDYFFSNVFLSVYMMSRHQKLYMHHVNVNITDRCTLRCRDCSLYVPYYKERKEYPLEKVLAGLDAFFSVVDYVQELHLIGGEPLLYPDLTELVAEIGIKYRSRIGEFAIATNGTILPKQELCRQSQQNGVLFTISDYTKSPVFEGRSYVGELVELLKQQKVSYRLGNKSEWFDFNNIPGNGYPASALQERFQECFFRNRGLYEGRLYYCQHQYGAFRAGAGEEDPDGYLNLNEPERVTKEQMLAFELGFLPKGYLTHCAKCNGFERLNTQYIQAAAQCKGDSTVWKSSGNSAN